MRAIFRAPSPTLAPIKGSDDFFPVRRVYCVGRNYAAHAREMGRDPTRDPPFFFTKWADTVVPSGSIVSYPPATQNLHYETELVVAIGRAGFNIASDQARDYIFGYAVGLDMTRRDLQLHARDQGRPWDVGKNFDQAAPLGPIHAVAPADEHPSRGRIWLQVNGETKQDADLSQLIWSVEEIIAHLSRLYALMPGDLIFTGTPEGVGAVRSGDRLIARAAALDPLEIAIR